MGRSVFLCDVGIHPNFSSIPSAFPDGPDGPEIRVISGKSHGKESPVRPLGGCWYFHAKFKQPGKIFQTLRKDDFPQVLILVSLLVVL